MRIRAYGRRHATVLGLAAGIALAVALLAMIPAQAQEVPCTGGGRGGDTGNVWGVCTGNSAPGQPSTFDQEAAWYAWCDNTHQAGEWGGVYQDVPGEREMYFSFVSYMTSDEYAVFDYDPTGVYAWYDTMCISWDVATSTWFHVDSGVTLFEESPPVPIQTMLDRAKDRVDPPYPTLAAAPPLDNVIVKAQTWLWLDGYLWEPIEESESQGMVTVYVKATPTRVEWEMGDSGHVECSGPGVPWTPGADDASSDCHYTFEDSSAILPSGEFSGSANVVFEVEWWMDDPWSTGRYMGGNGTIERATFFTVDVDEIQAIETG